MVGQWKLLEHCCAYYVKWNTSGSFIKLVKASRPIAARN